MRQRYSSFRSAIKLSTDHPVRHRSTSLTFIVCLVVGSLLMVSPAMSASLVTDLTEYQLGTTVGIIGSNFTANETVHLEITFVDGTPLPETISSSWDVVARMDLNPALPTGKLSLKR